ncbi:hypothetical protein GCM10009630_67090 [Kribbella jejuensis]|uniref:Flagellar basal body-associated protein FliL n=1 Tax=Kribbella jejuensis TaxID=236068 RepID=A0A542D9M4_9ACTN|nr:hypothetical protein [Kribbella jejuensis]TQI99782.1 hypothetical protein FB475_6769 [Kribbella jejuensis]
MSNQQQPPYGGPGGQQPYGGQPQPGYGPPPGQQPPPQQRPPQQPGQYPPGPGVQQPGPQQPGQYQQQPGYGGQYPQQPQRPPQAPQQQGYPGQQQYPGQQYQQPGFLGQQPQYGGQQPWAQQPPRKSGGSGKTLLIAGGAFALVAIIGVVLALIFKGGDDQADPTPIPTGAPTAQPTGQPTEQPTGEPTASPTGAPTTQPSTGGDEGIAVAEGIYVKPASGYVRQSLDGYSGVFLVKQGEGIFMVAAAKTTESGESILSAVVKANTKSLSSVKTNPVKTVTPGPDDKTPVKVLMSQAYSGVRTSQSGSFAAVGFVAVIERNDGVITVAQAYGRKDKLATLDPESTAMLKSVLESQ